jgi:mRNA-degrading endonuclease RelE of RelBE toxin-antitoxin system
MAKPPDARPLPNAPEPRKPGHVAIGYTPQARRAFEGLSRKAQDGLEKKLVKLALNPELGKPLIRELSGYLTETYGRVRAIVRLQEGVAVVFVLVLAPRREGSREDPYAIARAALANHEAEAEAAFARFVRAALLERE